MHVYVHEKIEGKIKYFIERAGKNRKIMQQSTVPIIITLFGWWEAAIKLGDTNKPIGRTSPSLDWSTQLFSSIDKIMPICFVVFPLFYTEIPLYSNWSNRGIADFISSQCPASSMHPPHAYAFGAVWNRISTTVSNRSSSNYTVLKISILKRLKLLLWNNGPGSNGLIRNDVLQSIFPNQPCP